MRFSATWIDLEIIILSEVSQTEKDKYDITHMWNVILERYKLTYLQNRLGEIENKLMVSKEEMWMGGVN